MISKPIVFVSTRTDEFPGRNETRDAIDQNLISFLSECGLTPVTVPNNPKVASAMLESVQAFGVVLSGGSNTDHRESTEKLMVEKMLERGKPTLGICHGFQQLVRFNGGKLEKRPGHVRTRHTLFSPAGQRLQEVNSYHDYAVIELPRNWETLAQCEDETVEWAKNTIDKLMGIMWHPERETRFSQTDIQLVREHFGL